MRSTGEFSGKIKFDDGQSYGERELSQLIRRRMMTKEYASKKDYKRTPKHKRKYEESDN